MRFFVEVTPIGKNDTQKYCVDADSWQKALQHARSIRKEDGSISGFSIELADDGYRAVDPTARLRYMVKKAPADAELSAGASQAPPPVSSSVRPPPVAPVAVQSAPVAAPAPVAAAQPPPQSITAPAPSEQMAPRESRRVASRTMSFGSSGTALLASSAAPQTQSAPPVASQVVPKAPTSRPAPPRAAVSPSVPPPPVAPLVSSQTAEKKQDSHPVENHDAQAHAANGPTTKRPPGPIVVLYKKEQEPTNASPISYREEVFAAPPGTTEEQAEAILRAQFRIVSDSLATSPSGKYVNIAVFDRVFEGRPPVPPLATLSWKDWKSNGGPTITFPRRAKAQLATATQPSNLADAAAQAVQTGKPASQRPPRRSEAPASDEQRVVAASAPPARARVEPEANTTVVVAEDSAPKLHPAPVVPPPQYIPQEAQYIPQIPAPAFVQPAPVPAPHIPPPEMAAVVLEPVAHFPAPVPAQAAPQPAYVEPAPPPPPAASSSSNVTGSPSSPHIRRGSWKQTPAALDGSRVRVRGDELIGLLFEEMHDLNFMADALEGAAFCLNVALDKLPSKAGFVHFYDIDKREYVVASVAGAVGAEQATKRNSQNDPWLAEAMRRRSAYVVGDATTHEGANVERFAAIGGARSVIVAPVMLGGRALGAIEIVNPIDGAPFGDDDANALAYMAEQFAEFVSSHGLVTDEGRIRRASLQPPA